MHERSRSANKVMFWRFHCCSLEPTNVLVQFGGWHQNWKQSYVTDWAWGVWTRPYFFHGFADETEESFHSGLTFPCSRWRKTSTFEKCPFHHNCLNPASVFPLLKPEILFCFIKVFVPYLMILIALNFWSSSFIGGFTMIEWFLLTIHKQNICVVVEVFEANPK